MPALAQALWARSWDYGVPFGLDWIGQERLRFEPKQGVGRQPRFLSCVLADVMRLPGQDMFTEFKQQVNVAVYCNPVYWLTLQ